MTFSLSHCSIAYFIQCEVFLFHGCIWWGSAFHSLHSLLRYPELNLNNVNWDQYLRMISTILNVFTFTVNAKNSLQTQTFFFTGDFTFERRWSGLARTRRRKFTELRDPSLCPELLRLHPVAWWRVKGFTVSLMFFCHKLLNDCETESVSLKRNYGSECKY